MNTNQEKMSHNKNNSTNPGGDSRTWEWIDIVHEPCRGQVQRTLYPRSRKLFERIKKELGVSSFEEWNKLSYRETRSRFCKFLNRMEKRYTQDLRRAQRTERKEFQLQKIEDKLRQIQKIKTDTKC